MRNILLTLVCATLFVGGVVSRAQARPQQENVDELQDSTVSVVAYFSKNDTLVYWIDNSRWKFTPTDTVQTGLVSAKVRLTVVDSTATGYKMDYTFLEIKSDSVENSALSKFQNAVTEKLAQKMVGNTISFETDEFGAITKINDLDKVKQQAKTLFSEGIDEMFKVPEIAKLKEETNIDLKAMAKKIDTDKLVDSYLEELKLLFAYHGLAFAIGQSHGHQDASNENYENDTYTTVTVDPESYNYSVEVEAFSFIPREDVKEVLGYFIEELKNDHLRNAVGHELDNHINFDAGVIIESLYSIDCLANGCPLGVVSQTVSSINGYGQIKQTTINLDYANY